MSMMVSFCAVFFPRGVLDEILNLIESVSEGFYFLLFLCLHQRQIIDYISLYFLVNNCICYIVCSECWVYVCHSLKNLHSLEFNKIHARTFVPLQVGNQGVHLHLLY